MTEAVYAINFDANGQIVSVTKDGVEATECDPPEGDPTPFVQYGSDPANGEGVEFVKYPNGVFCVHWFCRLYCF